MRSGKEELVDGYQVSLLRLKAELKNQLAQADSGCQPVQLDQSKVGRVSRIDAIQQQNMAQAGKRAREQRLRLVLAALIRLQRGEFGECLDCGEPIDARRLQIRPETPYCLECQSDREG